MTQVLVTSTVERLFGEAGIERQTRVARWDRHGNNLYGNRKPPKRRQYKYSCNKKEIIYIYIYIKDFFLKKIYNIYIFFPFSWLGLYMIAHTNEKYLLNFIAYC